MGWNFAGGLVYHVPFGRKVLKARFDMGGIGFLGTGSARPNHVLTTSAKEVELGLVPGQLSLPTGVSSRFVAQGETSVGLGVEAATQALAAAGLRASDVDLILSASAIPYQAIPSTAPLYQRALGLSGVPCFDINATCLSFLSAADVARSMIAIGRARHVLVVSSEIASLGLPWHAAPETAALFGDGAAAAVLGPVDTGGIRAVKMETYSEAYEACQVPIGGTRLNIHADPEGYRQAAWFQMDGQVLYKLTAKKLRRFVAAVLEEAGWTMDDVELVIPHQASRGGIDHAMRMLGLAPHRVIDILETHGNQIAASIPTAMDTAVRSGRLKPGTKALMVGTSAGVSLGALAWEA